MEDKLQSYTTRAFWWNWHFPDNLFNNCKNNVNETHNTPIEIKNKIKLMSMEQVLYAQAVMLHQKDLNISEANKNKIKLNLSSKVSLQDHSVDVMLVLIYWSKF